jgi:hypothetical protein
MIVEFSEIKLPFTKEEVSSYEHESEFMSALVDLHKEVIKLLYKCCEQYLNDDDTPKKLSRDNAIIGGNMTRLTKLNGSFLQNICEKKSEICFILERCISETCVNLKFMLLKGEKNVLRNYIKYSLITERKLYELVNNNIKSRDGIELPIENRIKKSIENSFDSSDFELEEIKNSSKWKSVASRAEAIGDKNYYNVMYGISSHSIHGNWQEILYNHLHEIDDEFGINLNWIHPRPQILEGTMSHVLEVVDIFAQHEVDNSEIQRKIKNIANSFQESLSILSFNHEKCMNKKNN